MTHSLSAQCAGAQSFWHPCYWNMPIRRCSNILYCLSYRCRCRCRVLCRWSGSFPWMQKHIIAGSWMGGHGIWSCNLAKGMATVGAGPVYNPPTWRHPSHPNCVYCMLTISFQLAHLTCIFRWSFCLCKIEGPETDKIGVLLLVKWHMRCH